MKSKRRSLMTKKAVGKKQEAMADSSSLYSLYRTSFECPLWVYLEVVCNDNLNALIIEGNPSQADLESAKIDLLTEFAEISDNTHAKVVNGTLRQMYQARANILELEICVNLVSQGIYEQAFAILSRMGLSFKEPKTSEQLEKIIKRITGYTKGKIIQFNEAHKRYKELSDSGNGTRSTMQDYVDQLALISKHIGFNLSIKTITLSEYASYLKIYRHGNNK